MKGVAGGITSTLRLPFVAALAMICSKSFPSRLKEIP
jgi:hypothetical protein